MASDAFSVSTQEVIENVSAINQVLTDKVTVLTELAINVQATMESLLQSSIKELESVSSIIESRSVADAQKVIGDLVTKLQDFPSIITQTVESLSSRVSNFVKSLPSTLLSSLPSGLGTLPSLVSTLPSQLSSLIPGLPFPTFQPHPWSSFSLSSLSFWPWTSHGLSLPSLSTLLSWSSLLALASPPVWQPWPSPCLLAFFHLSLPALEHYLHW